MPVGGAASAWREKTKQAVACFDIAGAGTSDIAGASTSDIAGASVTTPFQVQFKVLTAALSVVLSM
ncbi:MAG: hypothetical protein ACR2P9_06510 [Gammaproteobacteria bacterium]